ncbi:hypothetical protein EN858_26375 [Mesorhizobium sp. M4B.F.Ca.ET.215.01.1.1]|uniref:Stf0 family sulfotransferase n=1 Tax=unclassified Mesorhizobium TaxID=325217 RepID=UPI000FCC5380|nr:MULTISPECIES: Stf0 family sulfotransferase [unclassified Mesorhizobium]RUW26192.1 hypothetical protein EOA34_09200 [Mesorhizobium sp. M4B.F.Ca.ET.013.02.1.1]RVD37823.1 hypothetical protein EN741_22475 [Mesorhizobium sp. M4B.F.Ca.ET.019.03.1.1]RWF65536.1 MAG: hypothetical protein EOS47_10280 [Mesorhizobium sp.]TGQ06383.1 hypothetical protein EN858_26375 [Mesorhizobium sp. M4B.F.Ca.ET.215.01.1.1]TGQ31546.1 hypothetical protein EN857_25115 [Mesorhizobium sp. M4B.F.Ca.ET.214.01.1.1]
MHFEEAYGKLLSAAFDQAGSDGNPIKILICTTPRTAGHSYCRVLKHFGLGLPTEYFQWQFALPLLRRWTGHDAIDVPALDRAAASYGRQLLARRSVNGVFAAKLFAGNLNFARNAIGQDDTRSFYVFLSRRNKVEQTVSLLAMLYTGQPFDGGDTLPGIPKLKTISQKAVIDTVRHIADSEVMWRNYLSTIDPMRVVDVVYEDFVASPYENVRATMRNWFPAHDLDKAAIEASARYQHDADMKRIIARQFGSLIRDLWRDMPGEPDRPLSAP